MAGVQLDLTLADLAERGSREVGTCRPRKNAAVIAFAV
ncbi:hypothetical protein J2X70_003778 [Stenotrophomonas sp. 1337]|nr:hypothetical protein [Stenotrophomonas sp. 1337]